VRVAVLGQGSIGRRHAGLLRELGCEVVTYDPVAGGSAAGEDEALAAADAVVVASPSSEHARQAEAAIRRGLPTLVEKPLALDGPAASRVARLAAERGVPLAVAMNLRYHAGPRTVRELLPEIGRPLRAAVWCGTWLPGWRPGTDYRETYSAQRALGGGVLLDIVHEVDELLWLLGPAATVSALLPTVSDLEIDVEDVALLQLQLASGVPATVTLDYLDRGYHRGCRIVGSEGTVAWEWTAEEVVVHGPGGETRHVPASSDVAPTYRAELEDFLAAVRGGRAPAAPAADALAVMGVLDAARVAHAEGRRVAVGVALRPAGPEDRDRVLAWRNEPDAVAASLTGTAVDPADHAAWFERVLGDPARALWIAEEHGRPVGSIRLDRDADDPATAEVSIALAPQARGRRLATAALDQAAQAAPHILGVSTLRAVIKPTNEPSLRAFAAAGYREHARATEVTLLRAVGVESRPGRPLAVSR
jgi:predicted dehydrogenase/RimJ/RimL family protein N-acetyltransferase